MFLTPQELGLCQEFGINYYFIKNARKWIITEPSVVSWSRWTHLENVGEVSEIEDVVEFDCCGQECGGNFLMEGEGQIDQLGGGFLQRRREVPKLQVLSQDGAIDGGQGVCSRKGEDKNTEVTLQGNRGTWGCLSQTLVITDRKSLFLNLDITVKNPPKVFEFYILVTFFHTKPKFRLNLK